jgi:hypothetical protein
LQRLQPCLEGRDQLQGHKLDLFSLRNQAFRKYMPKTSRALVPGALVYLREALRADAGASARN